MLRVQIKVSLREYEAVASRPVELSMKNGDWGKHCDWVRGQRSEVRGQRVRLPIEGIGGSIPSR